MISVSISLWGVAPCRGTKHLKCAFSRNPCWLLCKLWHRVELIRGSPSYQTSGVCCPPVSLLTCEYSWISVVALFSFPALLLFCFTLPCSMTKILITPGYHSWGPLCLFLLFWWHFGSDRLGRNLLWQQEYLQELLRTLGLPLEDLPSEYQCQFFLAQDKMY